MRQPYTYQRGCVFCKKKIEEIDYKDAQFLKRFTGIWAKIKPGRETGVCSKHQRELTKAIKRARYLALMPYVTR